VLHFGDGIFRWNRYTTHINWNAKRIFKWAHRSGRGPNSKRFGMKRTELESTMKKFLLGTVGLMALGAASVPASAADLAARPVYTKAAPMMAVIYDWSGFYIGGNGGWGQERDNRTDPFGVALGRHDANGGTAGGQIGYRWQTGPAVFGLEAQGNWADFTGSNASLIAPAVSVHSKMDAFGLFTGQIGYAWNNVLLYAKGGAAVTDTKYDAILAGVVTASSGDNTRWGAVVGAGLEYGFAPNWSAAVEYDHIFQDGHSSTFTTPAGVVVGTFRDSGDTDLVTARINYRWGGPVIAKY
jgi:outer membrane immunogenic protein